MNTTTEQTLTKRHASEQDHTTEITPFSDTTILVTKSTQKRSVPVGTVQPVSTNYNHQTAAVSDSKAHAQNLCRDLWNEASRTREYAEEALTHYVSTPFILC